MPKVPKEFFSAHTHLHTHIVSLHCRVRSARGEVEGRLSEVGEGGAGTWRGGRSRISVKGGMKINYPT